MLLRNLFFGLCFSGCGAVCIGLFSFLATAPRLVTAAVELLRMLLRLSYSAYSWLLMRLSVPVLAHTGLDILTPWPRVISAILLSFVLGWAIAIVFGHSLGLWWAVACALHGFLVGLFWQRIESPGEFHLGERLP